ncbi:hypothetical protein [Acetobacter oeni]|uniref:Uncharacterized protein n=1 Tax=Acetobacter oeni TaxID=304077 RepID=A0A511XKD1_9PROT|nr:hypothetical protein [Acetobacter oeni]MBB3883841.1 putative membrane protein [Acetobacter oeni]GEN63404.1 hypothetical protein AOE01nite_16280 [Acetobacter oeni]
MAKKETKNDVPIISMRALLVMHGILIVFVGLMAWLDWSLPGG